MSDTPRRKQGVPTLTSIGYAGSAVGKGGRKLDPREVPVSPSTVQGFAPLSDEEITGKPASTKTPADGTRPLPMMESLRVRNPTETPLERPRIQMPPAESPRMRTPAAPSRAHPPADFAATQPNPLTQQHQVPRPVPSTPQSSHSYPRRHLDQPVETMVQTSLTRPASPAATRTRPELAEALRPAVSGELGSPGAGATGAGGRRPPVAGADRSRAQVPITPDEAQTAIFQRDRLLQPITNDAQPLLRRLQRWWFLLPVAPLTFVFAYLVFGAPDPQPRALSSSVPTTSALPTDRSALVERGALEVSLRAEGRVLGGVGTEIRPEVEGVVAAVHVKDGQTVKEGEPLLTFDGASLRKQLRAASQAIIDRKAELTVQRLRRDAVKRDMNSGLLWPAEMEAAEAELGRAEGRLKAAVAAKRRLDERGRASNLTAPAAGVVRDLAVKVGDRLAPGGAPETPPLMIIEEPGKLAIEVDLAPEVAPQVTVGSKARVNLGEASGDKALEGSITALPDVPVKSANGTEIRRAELLVDAGPQASALAAGTTVSVRLPGEKKQGVLLVPAAAVTTDNAGASVEVWSPAEQQYERRVVQTGATDDTHVEVLNNLSVGDRVRLPGKI